MYVKDKKANTHNMNLSSIDQIDMHFHQGHFFFFLPRSDAFFAHGVNCSIVMCALISVLACFDVNFTAIFNQLLGGAIFFEENVSVFADSWLFLGPFFTTIFSELSRQFLTGIRLK
jgi:hypothetical protein